jgi:cleavage and polyadenylation specificity factor subunit 4|tara:strand:- start:1364 stop:1573 length:210 start_codon:yes stop_codon:yes gene_type:complete
MDPLGDGDAELDLDSMLGYEEEHAPPEPANADPRRKKVVCKHWLRGLCKRGDDCDFLHRCALRVALLIR